MVLATFEVDDYVMSALRAGASGFLSKSVEPEELLQAIRVVAAGDALLSPKATKSLISRYLSQPHLGPANTADPALDVLTERDREIVTLVAHGLSNDEFADKLYLSPLTVKTHVMAMTAFASPTR